MLYVCDNQALLKAVKRWVGEGRKMTLVGAPDADILRKAIEELCEGTTAGATISGQNESASRRTWKWRSRRPSRQGYVKQKCSHGISRQDKLSSLLTWLHFQEPRKKGSTVSYADRKSTRNSRMRKSNRQKSAEEEVRKHRDRVTGAWKHISKQRRRINVRYDPNIVTVIW